MRTIHEICEEKFNFLRRFDKIFNIYGRANKASLRPLATLLLNLIFNRKLHRERSFSTYATFSEKLTFLTPWYASGGKKCKFFGKFCVRFKWMTPYPDKVVRVWCSLRRFFSNFSLLEKFKGYLRWNFKNKQNLELTIIRPYHQSPTGTNCLSLTSF